ncbi:SAGA-associated factor 29 isoform X2 [Diabrotica virgifera virgifera]|uniref:SGF29 C-terminal domain-containing protein n=1 Tax=Diabrotica virgifera virgifera TaxID=50390 RepID=A0ABM5KTP7_DIAVI|nr:SAGA-associated factor 29 isoform X2 [Diabrotica virgifera virgifera]
MPFTADAAAAQQVQERLKSVQQLVHEIEKKRAQCELGIAALQNYTQDEKGGHSSQKLKSLYKNVIAQTEQEEDVIRKALLKITEIRNIKNERRIQVGDMVAALAKHATEGENWILAEVVCYNHSTSKYEVDDILKEQNQKGRHTLSRSRVIPLPLMRANPETDPQALFPQGTLVMALFPQTTCFYQALVNKPPSTHMDEYELLFEDPNYTEGYSPPHSVVQRYVIACKQKNKQAGQGTS